MRSAVPFAALALLGALALPLTANAQDWPMARRDAERTALQTLPGDIVAPAVTHSIPVGGAPSQWLVQDVDLDGQPEVVSLRGGRAIAKRFDGTLVWASDPFGLTSLSAIDDSDGDGELEVYAGSSLQGLFVLDGRTGALLWRPDWSPEQRLGDVFPLDVDGDGRLELYVADNGCGNRGRGTGRIYSFAPASAVPSAEVTLDVSAHGYWCGQNQSAGDLDGDMRPEIIALSDDRVIAYDPRTGEPRWHSAPIGRFPYGRGTTTVRDLTGDGRAEIVITSNDGTAGVATSKRLVVLGLDGGEIVVRWSRVFDASEGLHAFVRDPVADLVPGGPLEIVTSAYDPSDGWALLVISGDATGTAPPLLTLPNRLLVAVGDVTGDGRTEIVTVDASAATIPSFGTLRALRLGTDSPSTVEEVWRHDDASLVLEPARFGVGSQPIRVGDAGVLLLRDGDGDGRAETLLASEDGGPTRSPGASLATGRSLGGSFDGLAVTRTDGYIERLDSELRLGNDAGGGVPALREQSHAAPGLVVGHTSSGPVLVTGNGDRALVGFARAGDVFSPRWRRSELLTGGGSVPPSFLWLDDERVAFHARRSDGTLDLVVVDGSTGTAAAPPVALAGSSLVTPLGAPFALDDGRLLQATFSSQSGTIHYAVVDLAAGTTTDPGLGRPLSASYDRPPVRFDVGADGTPDVVVPQGTRLTIADGASATRIGDAPAGSPGGVAQSVDLDEDGIVDLLYGGGFGVQRLAPDLTQVWAFELTERHHLQALAPTADGVRVATARTETPLLRILRGTDGSVVVELALAGGETFPTLDAAVASGEIVGLLTAMVSVADLTGAGEPAFVVGSTDGHLYALAATDGALLWSLPLRTAMGSPIAADADGDGVTDILVPASDGHVYVVGSATLETPAAVYDTDGTFVAAGPEDDLDVLETATTVGASWPPVPNATGYSYQIVREDDVVVVPWTDVGAETGFTRTGLALQRGRRYVTLVRAHDRSGVRPRISAEAASDGFVVVDAAPPEVEVIAEPMVIWSDGGSSLPSVTEVSATLRDDVNLASYRLYIADAEGTELRELAAAPIGGTEQTVTRTWDGTAPEGDPVLPGRYSAEAEAVDAEGRVARGSAPIVVCARGAEDLPECVPAADAGAAGDAAPPADGGLEGPWQVDGGGCQCDTGQRAGGQGLPLALVAIALAVGAWRRRRPRGR